MEIIGFTGGANQGKDTSANLLVKHHGFIRRGFMDPMYEEVSKAFNVSIDFLKSEQNKDILSDKMCLKNCQDPLFLARMDELGFFDLFVERSPRFILQSWGTDYRRNIDPLVWIKEMDQFIHQLPSAAKVAISDIRTDDEADFCSNKGGFIFKVIKPNAQRVESHKVEAGIAMHYINATILNQYQLDDKDHPDDLLRQIEDHYPKLNKTNHHKMVGV